MSHRKMLYGYRYQSAELSPLPEEAEIVRRIFTMYLDGQSYQRIADTLNGERVPFSSEDANWNKHKIKRLLENPRYGGADGYTPIIDSSVFRTVSERIGEKNAHLRQTRPAVRLRDRLWCAECGRKLTITPREETRDNSKTEEENENGSRRAGRTKDVCEKDCLHVMCRTCGWTLDLPDRTLLARVKRRAAMDNRRTEEPPPYTPSAEVVRLANAVNRGLEKPDDPEEVLALILQDVSARYDCCADTAEAGAGPPSRADLKTIIQRVSRIDISKDGKTAVTFRIEQDR